MRKRIISTILPSTSVDWLPLDQLAAVEVTSEESEHPVENALLPNAETGWQAAQPGEQTIRLIFDSPQPLKHIRLIFIERDLVRSQEFVLRWSADAGQTFHEIVRQQWNFSPPATTQEVEDYQVELLGVTQLELKIIPDRSAGEARATLAQLRLA